MKCLVIDDDRMYREMVRKCVEKTDELELVGVCENAVQAIEILQREKVDLLFLDVEMPEITGIDLMKNFNDIPQVILITSKSEYAVEAFDHNVTDYIVKPVTYPRFVKAVDKARQINDAVQINPENSDTIFIKDGTTFTQIKLSEILWVEALGDYISLNTESQRFTILSTMKAMDSKLSAAKFIRIHRSFIVALEKISKIEENTVYIGDKMLTVSRNYKTALMNAIKTL